MSKNGFEHYMMKEIYDTPGVIRKITEKCFVDSSAPCCNSKWFDIRNILFFLFDVVIFLFFSLDYGNLKRRLRRVVFLMIQGKCSPKTRR